MGVTIETIDLLLRQGSRRTRKQDVLLLCARIGFNPPRP